MCTRSVSSWLVLWTACLCGATRADDQQLFESWRQSWQAQETAISTVTVEFHCFRGNSLGGIKPYSEAAFEQAISTALPRNGSPADFELISTSILGIPLATLPLSQFAFDGERKLEVFGGEKHVVDGNLHAVADAANRAIYLHDNAHSRQRVLHLRDFRFLPNVKLFDVATLTPESVPSPTASLSYVGSDGDRNDYRIDRTTGDVMRYEVTRPDGHLSMRILQADFRVLSGGARMPFVKFVINYAPQGDPDRVEAMLIKSMDVNLDIPRDIFGVSGDAGNVVFDFRGRGDLPPRSHELFEPEKDIVALVEKKDAETGDLTKSIGNRKPSNLLLMLNCAVVSTILVVLLVRKTRFRRHHQGEDPAS